VRLLVLFIVIGVLAPTGAVLWFMNEAARSQEASARQSVSEAYRGQLRLLRDRVDALWVKRAREMEQASDFRAAIQAAGADSAVLLDANRAVIYPIPAVSNIADPLAERADWIDAQMVESRRDRVVQAAELYRRIAQTDPNPSNGARAAQAQIRCQLAAGQKDAALASIRKYFRSGRIAEARDLSGRSIGADEQLLELKLSKAGDRDYAAGVQRLASRLNDYSGAPMQSAQRLFLIDALRALSTDQPPFPHYAAERLAAEFVEGDRPRPGAVALEASGVRGVWKLTSPNARAIALFRTETVLAALGPELGTSKEVRFAVTPPGTAGSPDAIATGQTMPGWLISFSLLDTKPFDDATRRRMATYLWVGYLVVAALALTGLVAGRFFGRQLKLARLKTDLVAAVSHELKTPLASMRLLVDSLLEDGASDPAKTREYLEMISGENLRLTRLIENFLTFSRIERNRQRFEFAPTSPAHVVGAALGAMRERLHAPGCSVEVNVSPGLPRIAADEDALVTVLLNLLDNAYKYTPKDKRITLRAYRDGGGLVFAVEDNGIGIAPHEQKRIFRRFYQVDRRLARETGGCGLGLSIVEFIVRAHGGKVKVESAAGSGSKFSVWLRCDAAAREAGA
jgi:signal transduction histidine kinase